MILKEFHRNSSHLKIVEISIAELQNQPVRNTRKILEFMDEIERIVGHFSKDYSILSQTIVVLCEILINEFPDILEHIAQSNIDIKKLRLQLFKELPISKYKNFLLTFRKRNETTTLLKEKIEYKNIASGKAQLQESKVPELKNDTNFKNSQNLSKIYKDGDPG